LTRIPGTLHEDQYRFLIYLAEFFVECENFPTKVAEKKYTLCVQIYLNLPFMR